LFLANTSRSKRMALRCKCDVSPIWRYHGVTRARQLLPFERTHTLQFGRFCGVSIPIPPETYKISQLHVRERVDWALLAFPLQQPQLGRRSDNSALRPQLLHHQSRLHARPRLQLPGLRPLTKPQARQAQFPARKFTTTMKKEGARVNYCLNIKLFAQIPRYLHELS
jgi:hypothetical protein